MADANNTNNSKKSRTRLHLVLILCAAIIIYVVINALSYLFVSDDGLYEVVSGSTAGSYSGQYTALAIRNEKVYNASDSGYVNFFVGDATPIYVNEKIYVLDKNGEISDWLDEQSRSSDVLTDSELSQICSSFREFDTSLNNENYYETYNFKYKMQSQIMDLINNNLFEAMDSSISTGSGSNIKIENSDSTGIILHYTDGMESISPNDVEAYMFRRENYTKNIIKSNDYVNEGDPVYKIVNSEDWKLVIQINNEDDYDDLSSVKLKFLADNVTAEADIYTYTSAGNSYAVLSLDKYMIRYISDRYVQIELISDTDTGLKIPKTAVEEKQFYTIPVDYITHGGNSSSDGFLLSTTDSDGSASVEFISPEIVKETDEYCYISCDSLDEGSVLIKPETSEQYKVNSRESLKIAYVSDSGTYDYRIVDILGENGSYYIVSSSTKYGLKMYDNILADVSTKK